MIPFPDRKYSIIYADPPWAFDDPWTHKRFRQYGAVCHYEPMDTEAISQLPIAGICERDSVVFLWALSSHLPDALAVMQAWGFVYKSVAFVWCKESRNGKMEAGLGHYTMPNTEFVLVGRRGSGLRRVRKNVRQLVIAPRRGHSVKPAEVRDRIVQLYGDVPRIELFARQRVPGWDAWGLEVPPEEAQP